LLPQKAVEPLPLYQQLAAINHSRAISRAPIAIPINPGSGAASMNIPSTIADGMEGISMNAMPGEPRAAGSAIQIFSTLISP
jgi:hypothetical protein